MEILTPNSETEALLRSHTVHQEWLDDRGELCMWATVREDRPCLIAPGFAVYELHDDAVAATPFRPGVEGISRFGPGSRGLLKTPTGGLFCRCFCSTGERRYCTRAQLWDRAVWLASAVGPGRGSRPSRMD